MKIEHIIVSENGFSHADPNTIVQSNITVVNLLREEGVDDDDIPEDAMTSYYLDYYLDRTIMVDLPSLSGMRAEVRR